MGRCEGRGGKDMAVKRHESSLLVLEQITF